MDLCGRGDMNWIKLACQVVIGLSIACPLTLTLHMNTILSVIFSFGISAIIGIIMMGIFDQ